VTQAVWTSVQLFMGGTGEGTAMRIAGWSFGNSEARLAMLPAIAILGSAIW
jgi:hypothetical protein